MTAVYSVICVVTLALFVRLLPVWYRKLAERDDWQAANRKALARNEVRHGGTRRYAATKRTLSTKEHCPDLLVVVYGKRIEARWQCNCGAKGSGFTATHAAVEAAQQHVDQS